MSQNRLIDSIRLTQPTDQTHAFHQTAGEDFRWIVGQVINNNAKKGVCKVSLDIGGACFFLVAYCGGPLPQPPAPCPLSLCWLPRCRSTHLLVQTFHLSTAGKERSHGFIMDPGNLPVGSKQGQLAAVRGRGFETHPSPRVRSLILMLACTTYTGRADDLCLPHPQRRQRRHHGQGT